VWLAERPVGGPWRVGSALAELGVSARWPGIAIEPAGGLLATYWSGGPVVSAIRAATGPFGAPAPLSPAGESAEDPRLVTGPRGDALVAWGQPSAAGEGLRAAYRSPGAAFGAAETVPGPGTVFAGQSVGVALGAAGQAVIAQVRTEPARRAVVIAERAAGGAWSVPVVLAESTSPFGMASPQVAIDLAGNAVATWARFDGRHWVVDVSERSAATPTWSTPVTLSPASRDASRPALAVSPAGRAVVAWQEKRGAVIVLRARARPAPGTPFGASVTVGSSGPRRRGVPYQIAQVEPRIAFGPRERAITVWGSCFRDKLKGGGLGPVCLVQASSEK
jgi:hypothetical protein